MSYSSKSKLINGLKFWIQSSLLESAKQNCEPISIDISMHPKNWIEQICIIILILIRLKIPLERNFIDVSMSKSFKLNCHDSIVKTTLQYVEIRFRILIEQNCIVMQFECHIKQNQNRWKDWNNFNVRIIKTEILCTDIHWYFNAQKLRE